MNNDNKYNPDELSPVVKWEDKSHLLFSASDIKYLLSDPLLNVSKVAGKPKFMITPQYGYYTMEQLRNAIKNRTTKSLEPNSVYSLVKMIIDFMEVHYNPTEAHFLFELMVVFSLEWLEEHLYIQKTVDSGGFTVKWNNYKKWDNHKKRSLQNG